MPDYLDHGSRHRPGGTDPIPGLGGGSVFARAWNDFSGDTAQVVTASTQTPAAFAHTETTDSSVISFSTSVHTNDTVTLHSVGIYLLFVGALWDASALDLYALIEKVSGPSDNAFPHQPFNPNSSLAVFDTMGACNSQDYAVCYVSSGGVTQRVLLENGEVADHSCERCYFTIVYLSLA